MGERFEMGKEGEAGRGGRGKEWTNVRARSFSDGVNDSQAAV